MKRRPFLILLVLLAGSLTHAAEKSGAPRPDAAVALPEKERDPSSARVLLEKGRAAGAWPRGMVVRVGACLGELEAGTASRLPVVMKETWEFTDGRVRCVLMEGAKGEQNKPTGESRRFDTKGVCEDLLAGRAIEIHARNGKGPKVGFIGSAYRRGSRSIEVEWKGKTILNLMESNGPFLEFYRESDARAFGALYERLAGQARAAFTPKAGGAR